MKPLNAEEVVRAIAAAHRHRQRDQERTVAASASSPPSLKNCACWLAGRIIGCMKSLPRGWAEQQASLWPGLFFIGLAVGMVHAQDLAPRAYLVTPTGSSAVILTWSFFDGSVFTDPTVPITDSRVRFQSEVLSYYHSFGLFGRSANATGSLPYAVGNFRGIVVGAEQHVYRSGLADARMRFTVNIRGGPAMSPREFRSWRERTVIGASLTVVAPTGQYDPARLVNPGLHRWAVKPELGFSRRWGRWTVDLYGGLWAFTMNDRYFPGTNARSQAPVGAGEVHLSYYLKRMCWVSLDGNFWTGGRTSINGSPRGDYQRNSRLGATAAIPLNRHHSLKVSYNRGAYISIGGDYQNISLAWQYSWIRGAE